jgi:hypothetical protein
VAIATGAARLSVHRRSWGSVAAGAVRDGCCRSISVHLQRGGEVASQLPLEQHEMVAAGVARVSCHRSNTTQCPSEKLGISAAGAVRDSCCRSISHDFCAFAA